MDEARREAILFWKPSRLMLESGMLPGSAQTFSTFSFLAL